MNSTFFNPMFGLRKSVRISEIFRDSPRNIYLGVPVFSRFCSPKQVSKNTRDPTEKFFCAAKNIRDGPVRSIAVATRRHSGLGWGIPIKLRHCYC